jgi:hypothetical protein
VRGTLARHAFKRRHRSSILTQRTQGKTPPPRRGKELLGRGISDPSLEPARSDYWLVGPHRCAHVSAPLRCAPRDDYLTQKILLEHLGNRHGERNALPVDNPHRGSGDWLGGKMTMIKTHFLSASPGFLFPVGIAVPMASFMADRADGKISEPCRWGRPPDNSHLQCRR